uniref:Uncharacterized protein n=1 Tax=Caenorhabditis tropicalis TaxID=1561998 RepID=A0A1I7UM64_9PELO
MAGASDNYFFAAYRGYYTNGTTFLQIVGLGKNNYQSFHVREGKLNECNIKLGDFLSATVPLGEPVKNFIRQNYKFKVTVDGNNAKVENEEGELERNSDGSLVFRNKTFGLIRSINQNLPLGKYRITIRATNESEEDLFKNMKFCAEEKEKIDSSSNKFVIVGTGFGMQNLSLNNKKSMNAFVYSVINKGDFNTYFLWICDNHEKSIFTSKQHNLGLGHFFEGIFEETPNGKSKWQCVKYVKSINSLLEGEIIGRRIELKTRISQYHPGFGRAFPTVRSEYLGTIIDKEKKLPSQCDGKTIKTQLCKIGEEYEWIVTDLL